MKPVIKSPPSGKNRVKNPVEGESNIARRFQQQPAKPVPKKGKK